MKPDIVLALSDQHSGLYTSLPGGGGAPTPFLERLGRQGAVFSRAYCSAPLCVPSRCSLLSGRLPHETGIFDNDGLLPEDMPTIAHAMSLAGYDTVLAGRMHFKGGDQNHGFDRRLVGDITTQYWGTARTDLGDFAGTLQASGCQRAAGCGPSPVDAYDEAVVRAAERELLRRREKPLFLIVGLYSPHFPYVAPQEEFLDSLRAGEDVSDVDWDCFPCYASLVQPTRPDRVRLIRGAYRAAVKRLDSRVERIYRAYQAGKRGPGVFVYTSDHGDQLGKRGIFGKKTVYEDSIRVPLVVEDGVHRGEVRREAVSLLDLTKTLLEYGDARLPGCGGASLFGAERPPVKVEAVTDDGSALIQAVIRGDRKLIRLPQGDRLCAWEEDPREETDFCRREPETAAELEKELLSPEEAEDCLERYRLRREGNRLLKQWGREHPRPEPARFVLPPDCVRREDPYFGRQWLEQNSQIRRELL